MNNPLPRDVYADLDKVGQRLKNFLDEVFSKKDKGNLHPNLPPDKANQMEVIFVYMGEKAMHNIQETILQLIAYENRSEEKNTYLHPDTARLIFTTLLAESIMKLELILDYIKEANNDFDIQLDFVTFPQLNEAEELLRKVIDIMDIGFGTYVKRKKV